MKRVLSTLFVLCLARIASAGTPFAQMPDVGPIATWPHPTTFAFHSAIDRLITNRLNESTLMRSRVRYIRQAFDGSPTGGGTTGLSAQTAWKCRTMADVRALVQAQLQTNTTVLFRCGDTFYASPFNTDQGIPSFPFGRYTFSSYVDPASPSSAKPRLLGFVPINPLNLESFAPNTYGFKTPYDVYWVRGRRIGSDFARGYRDFPYIKQPDPSQISSFERTWAIDANRNLRIRIGTSTDSDDLGTLEAVVATGAGIDVSEVDDVRIDGLIIEGWGVNNPTAGNGSIRSSAAGTQSLIVTNCEWGWTAYHGLLHAANTTGGIVLVKDCAFGYHVNRDAATGGSGDGLVSFSYGGGNELVIDGCRSFGGGLSRTGVVGASGNNLGSPVYQHSAAGQNIALQVRRNCTFVPIHPTRSHYEGYSSAADAVCDLSGHAIELPPDPLDIRYYRAFVIGETALCQTSMLGGGWRAVDINCHMICKVPALTSGVLFWWGGLRNVYAGLSINRDQEIIFDPGFQATYGFGTCTINHNHVMLNCRLRFTGASPTVPTNFVVCEADPSRLSTSRLINTIVSNETQAASLRWNYPNASALSNAGGMANCAYFHVSAAYYALSGSPVGLSAPANFVLDDPHAVPAELVGAAAESLPNGLRLEYDSQMNPRPVVGTIGPSEGIPAQCTVDINRDGVVDLFDYLDFISAWGSGAAGGDFNRDGAIDLFDYLDFVAQFSTGC